MPIKIFNQINLKNAKAVIFDTDNTLYPYPPAHKLALNFFLQSRKLLILKNYLVRN